VRVVRGLRRSCFAGATVLAASALLAPAAGGQEAPADDARPGTWSSRAAATAIGLMINTEPPQVTPEIVNASIPDSDTQFDASIAKARASTVYPGLLAAQGANLTCQFQCAPVPPYALSAYAENPQQPDARIETGQEVPVGEGGGVQAGTAVAHAAEDGVSAKATNGRFDLSGGPATAAAALDLRRTVTALVKGPVAAATVKPQADDDSLVHVDSAVSETSHVFKDGALVVTATSTLKGVHLLGGQIVIESIASRAMSTSDGQAAKVERSLKIGAITVAGQPAHLDDEGLAIGPSGSQGGDGFDALNTALADALGAAGIDVHALTGVQEVTGASGTASIEGVLVRAANPGVLGNGVTTALLLGKAGVAAAAAPFDSFGGDELVDDLTGDAEALTDLGPVGGDLALPSQNVGTDLRDGASGRPAAAPDGTAAAPDGEPRRLRPASFVDPAAGRLETLYLALALVAVGVALGWRRVLPSS
jgi:hypothetical protein